MGSSSPKVSIAIIGTGLIGPRHAQAVLKNPETTLTAVVDPAPRAKDVAASFSVPWYGSVKNLLESKDKPDAAIICTPNSTHISIAQELASAGVHILVEKPLCTSIASGLSLISQVKESNVQLLVGHNRRFNAYTTAVKTLISSNSLGRILSVSGLWTLYKPPEYYLPPTDWRQRRDAGTIFINLVHEIDLLQYLFGPIIRVHAEGAPNTRGYAADEGGAILLRFKNGIVATFLISDATPSPFNFESGTGENPTIPKTGLDFWRIFGTEASLSVPDLRRWSYHGREQKSWTVPIAVQDLSGQVEEGVVPFERQLEHFVRVVRGEEQPLCSGEEGLRALVVCEAVRKAMDSSESVDVEPFYAGFIQTT